MAFWCPQKDANSCCGHCHKSRPKSPQHVPEVNPTFADIGPKLVDLEGVAGLVCGPVATGHGGVAPTDDSVSVRQRVARGFGLALVESAGRRPHLSIRVRPPRNRRRLPRDARDVSCAMEASRRGLDDGVVQRSGAGRCPPDGGNVARSDLIVDLALVSFDVPVAILVAAAAKIA